MKHADMLLLRLARTLPLALLFAAAAPLGAQDSAGTRSAWTAGGRSTLLASPVRLSALNPAFEDLEPGYGTSAHSSSLFLMRRMSPNLSLGVETFVANSRTGERTSYLVQGAGPVAELTVGDPWLVSAGLQAGGIIASAIQGTGEGEDGVRTGSHYKGVGLFAAPSLGVGRRIGRVEVKLVAKYTALANVTPGMSRFNGLYTGLSLGYRL